MVGIGNEWCGAEVGSDGNVVGRELSDSGEFVNNMDKIERLNTLGVNATCWNNILSPSSFPQK